MYTRNSGSSARPTAPSTSTGTSADSKRAHNIAIRRARKAVREALEARRNLGVTQHRKFSTGRSTFELQDALAHLNNVKLFTLGRGQSTANEEA